jgi:rSAM/selenodomain-associated transferase 1
VNTPRHLVVFARAPMRGTVKSRLAADIGKDAALAFYRRTLHNLLWRLGRDPRWTTWLSVTPDGSASNSAFWPPVPGLQVVPQGLGDLGVRMARPMREFPPGPVLVVGSDIPDIAPEYVMAGFAALGQHDMVFGPAGDGGYWLVGAACRRPIPRGLFADIRWSSEHALSDTLASLPGDARVAMLGELDDIDDGAAWHAWRARHRGRSHS